uniref:MSCRAMM family protein n=1 Tax=Flavonifractor plautii TaxID=292800 RepID=UPI003FF1080E
PHYFEVENGETTTLQVENTPVSAILIHKTDSATGEGIYGVPFILYDSTNTPVGQYTSDNEGYVLIEGLEAGRYYLRELENEGYVPDTEKKTVYVESGETTEVEWENTPITGQIQITKTSADYNSVNGWPAGTPIPGTEFEIYNARTGNLVDTVETDKNGVASSRPLPLGRYKIVESKAADFYGLDKTPIEVEIEFEGQIVKAAMTNKGLYTNVSIQKTGYVEVMPGQQIRYDFGGIGNNSTTSLTSFYWRDTLPGQAVRLDKIVTGTYNVPGNYKVVYKTNLSGGTWRTLADNLSTQQNYVLDASKAALGLASNEYVTEFMVSFGVVPANFRQVEAPQVYATVYAWLTGGSQFVNQADVGGVYNGQWIMATSRWVTKVYKPAEPLPRTGY